MFLISMIKAKGAVHLTLTQLSDHLAHGDHLRYTHNYIRSAPLVRRLSVQKASKRNCKTIQDINVAEADRL